MQLILSRIGALVAALIVASIPTAAHAQHPSLERARDEFLHANFEIAQRELDAVLADPDSSREDIAEAHRYLCALALALGRQDDAQRHAAIAIAIAPDVTPPPGAPSRMQSLLDGARAARRGEPSLEIDLVLSDESRSAQARAEVGAVPPGLVGELTLGCVGPGIDTEVAGPPPRLELSVPRGRSTCRAAARTEGGATLLVAEEELFLPDDGGDGGEPVVATGTDDGMWIALGVGIGIAVALAVVIPVVVVTTEPGNPRINGVTIIGFE